MPDRHETFPNVAPGASVDKRNAPVWWPFTQNLDLLAELRDHAVAIFRLPIVEEIVLDNVCLVAEAKNEILMTMVAVIMHDMPQDRLMPDRHHRLWNALRVFANTGASPPQNRTTFMVQVLADL